MQWGGLALTPTSSHGSNGSGGERMAGHQWSVKGGRLPDPSLVPVSQTGVLNVVLSRQLLPV